MSNWTYVRGRRPYRAPSQQILANNPRFLDLRGNNPGTGIPPLVPHPRVRINAQEANFWKQGNRFAVLRQSMDTSQSRSRSASRQTQNTRKFPPKNNNPRPLLPNFNRQPRGSYREDKLMGENKKTVKNMHNLIRTIHHLNNIIDTEKQPPTIQRLTEFLGGIIKPACPSEETALLIEGNAKNWAYTTQIILKQHYEGLIDTLSQEILASIPETWEEFFETASRWAARILGRRLEKDTVEKARAIVVTLAQEKRENRTRTQDRDTPIFTLGEEDFPPLTTTQTRRKEVSPLSTTTQMERQEPMEDQNVVSMIVIHEDTQQTGDTAIATAQIHISTQTETQTMDTETDTKTHTRTQVSLETDAQTWEQVIPLLMDLDTHTVTEKGKPQRVGKHKRNPSVFEDHLGELDLITAKPMDTQETGDRPKYIRTNRAEENIVSGPQTCTVQIHKPPREEEREGSSPQSDNGTLLDESLLQTLFTPTRDDTPIMTPKPPNTERRQTFSLTPLQLPESPVSPLQQPEHSVTRPSRHSNTRRKLQDWNLTVTQKWLIMGDSNLSRITEIRRPNLQIDAFPGATFRHAAAILEKAVVTTKVEMVILSFGINHKNQSSEKTAIKQFQETLQIAKTKFNTNNIFVPLINYSNRLKLPEMKTLFGLNRYLKTYPKHIPKLSGFSFKTTTDNIHWTLETAEAMLDHWAQHLNYMAL